MEQRRTIVAEIAPTAGSQRTACRWLGVHRSAIRRPASRRDDGPLRRRLRELAAEKPRCGSPMLIWRLRQEGWPDNHKRIRRLYRLEGLAVRRRRKKRVAVPRVPQPQAPNERWAMDFVRVTLRGGRAFRALTIIDNYTRECVAIEVDVSLGSARVVAVLEQLVGTRGRPRTIVVDSGPEFQSRARDAWAHAHGVHLQFIRHGRPVENALLESFNGRLRDECLTHYWFLAITDAPTPSGAGAGATTPPGRTAHSSTLRRPNSRHNISRTT